MFWLKTHGCTVFLLLQLFVRFELKSVLKTVNDLSDDDDIGENLDKIDIEREDPEINRIKKKVDNVEESIKPSNFASMKKTKIIKKLDKDETEIRDRNTNIKDLDDKDEDDLGSLESQESVDNVEESRKPSNFASMKKSKIIKKQDKDETEKRNRDINIKDLDGEDDLDSLESQESVDNVEESRKPSNFASMKKSKIIKKLDKDETEKRDRDTNIKDLDNEDDLDSLESQESVHEVKNKDEDVIDIDKGKSSDSKTKKSQIAKKKVAKLEKFDIPIIYDSAKNSANNETKIIYPPNGENKDYALDDFWVDQPLDFYHYYQFTTPRPTTAAPITSSKSTMQVETDDYALDDFWEEQPFDFYHYYQFTTPRSTTVAPTPYYNEYYEYKDAYDYIREYSQDLIII